MVDIDQGHVGLKSRIGGKYWPQGIILKDPADIDIEVVHAGFDEAAQLSPPFIDMGFIALSKEKSSRIAKILDEKRDNPFQVNDNGVAVRIHVPSDGRR